MKKRINELTQDEIIKMCEKHNNWIIVKKRQFPLPPKKIKKC